jgi:hypothetical protein
VKAQLTAHICVELFKPVGSSAIPCIDAWRVSASGSRIVPAGFPADQRTAGALLLLQQAVLELYQRLCCVYVPPRSDAAQDAAAGVRRSGRASAAQAAAPRRTVAAVIQECFGRLPEAPVTPQPGSDAGGADAGSSGDAGGNSDAGGADAGSSGDAGGSEDSDAAASSDAGSDDDTVAGPAAPASTPAAPGYASDEQRLQVPPQGWSSTPRGDLLATLRALGNSDAAEASPTPLLARLLPRDTWRALQASWSPPRTVPAESALREHAAANEQMAQLLGVDPAQLPGVSALRGKQPLRPGCPAGPLAPVAVLLREPTDSSQPGVRQGHVFDVAASSSRRRLNAAGALPDAGPSVAATGGWVGGSGWAGGVVQHHRARSSLEVQQHQPSS